MDDKDRTKSEIAAMISQHVKAINNIYGDVIFEGRYKHQGIRFEVQRIKVRIFYMYFVTIFMEVVMVTKKE